MSLEAASIPLAGFAGVLSILSPCVWPLVPVVMSSAATSGRSGPWFLAFGLSTAFALAGILLTLVLLNLQLDPEGLRYGAATLLLLIAVTLLASPVADWMSRQLSRLTGRFNGWGPAGTPTAVGQFGVGALLGLVWLPCVGLTLGAAIALASLGQHLGLAFVILFAFAIGTSVVLLVAGLLWPSAVPGADWTGGAHAQVYKPSFIRTTTGGSTGPEPVIPVALMAVRKN